MKVCLPHTLRWVAEEGSDEPTAMDSRQRHRHELTPSSEERGPCTDVGPDTAVQAEFPTLTPTPVVQHQGRLRSSEHTLHSDLGS